MGWGEKKKGNKQECDRPQLPLWGSFEERKGMLRFVLEEVVRRPEGGWEHLLAFAPEMLLGLM